jgi:tryptophanyl-tRNA synthetase
VFPEPEALLSDAPTLPGIDGKKMSKSRHNAIAIAATAEETARLLRAAKTDADPHITYDHQNRPEVANLVLLTALCENATPEQVASEIAGRGAAELKRRATEIRQTCWVLRQADGPKDIRRRYAAAVR